MCLQDRLCPLAYSWIDRHNSPSLITNLNLWNFTLEIQEFCGIRAPKLTVRLKTYTNKCTVLEYTLVTVKTLEFRNVSTLPYGSSSGRVHQYLFTA
jgi:hypothetical protein